MNAAEKQIGKLLASTCRAAQQSTDPAKREAGNRWEQWIGKKLSGSPARRRPALAGRGA